jgi:hypothetical protein
MCGALPLQSIQKLCHSHYRKLRILPFVTSLTHAISEAQFWGIR